MYKQTERVFVVLVEIYIVCWNFVLSLRGEMFSIIACLIDHKTKSDKPVAKFTNRALCTVFSLLIPFKSLLPSCCIISAMLIARTLHRQLHDKQMLS